MDLETLIAKAGGPSKVAAIYGISSQAVSQWIRIPHERCVAFAQATDTPLDVVISARRKPDISLAAQPSEQVA